MFGTKRSAPRLLGTKHQRIDLIGAKVQVHVEQPPKTTASTKLEK